MILKYVIDHVEDSARDPLVILELGDNAQSFVRILESIIDHTRDYGTISSTCVWSSVTYHVLKYWISILKCCIRARVLSLNSRFHVFF